MTMTALHEKEDPKDMYHGRSPGMWTRIPRRGWLTSAFIVWIFGSLFCIVVSIAPEAVPRLVGKPGYTWTPFNSSNYRVGDFYYYAPWVRQIIRGELPLRPPTAGEETIGSTVENVRSAPYFVAALPGLLLSDFRNVLVADIALSAALFFLAFYVIALTFLQRPWPAFTAAILAYFYSGVWQAVGHNVQFLSLFGRPSSIGSWLDYSLVGATARFRVLLDPTEYDYISDAFRFMNLSISGPLLTLQLLLALLLFMRFSWPRAAGLFGLSLTLAFSYPSHPVVGYIAMICLAAAAFVERSSREFAALTATGCAVIAVLLAVDYPDVVRRAMQSTAMLQSMYLSNGIKLAPISVASLADTIVLNKYFLTTIMLAVLFFTDRRRRVAIVAIGASVTIVSWVTLLHPPELWQRFLARGIEIPWGAFVAAGFVQLFLLTKLALSASRVKAAVQIFGVAATVALCAVPALGFARFALRNEHNLTRFIPEDRWATYSWIATHLPARAAVATLDWDDMAFLPMYTDVSLAVGHADLSGRTPEQQLRRFVGLWKLLGRSRDQLGQLVATSIPALVRRYSIGDLRHPPLNTEEEYACSEFAAGLLYWPYLKSVDGIQIADNSMTSTNPDLVSHILGLYDQVDAMEFRRRANISYILVPPGQLDVLTLFPEAKLVFENTARSLYRIEKVSESIGGKQ
jgi:hypothetical protein